MTKGKGKKIWNLGEFFNVGDQGIHSQSPKKGRISFSYREGYNLRRVLIGGTFFFFFILKALF